VQCIARDPGVSKPPYYRGVAEKGAATLVKKIMGGESWPLLKLSVAVFEIL